MSDKLELVVSETLCLVHYGPVETKPELFEEEGFLIYEREDGRSEMVYVRLNEVDTLIAALKRFKVSLLAQAGKEASE